MSLFCPNANPGVGKRAEMSLFLLMSGNALKVTEKFICYDTWNFVCVKDTGKRRKCKGKTKLISFYQKREREMKREQTP